MARTQTISDSLAALLDLSQRPIYAIDAQRRVAYCNPALASWLELEPARIVGRLVEYHSDSAAGGAKNAGQSALTDLCPPPRALAGEMCAGTISCVARGGRLAHRRADFVPLHLPGVESDRRAGGGVLVFLRDDDLSPQELAAGISGGAAADDLHRSIRRFRRTQASNYAIESLLGQSSAMQKVRRQVVAAAASEANALIIGRPGTGRGHIARAIHYHAAGEAAGKLVPLDCEIAGDDTLRRALDAAATADSDTRQQPTLLLENLDRLPSPHQSHLVFAIQNHARSARIIATCASCSRRGTQNETETAEPIEDLEIDSADGRPPVPGTIDSALLDAISTIIVRVPRLVERLEDLPILAQCFLESCNPGSQKQIGSLRADALDRLALYSWPGELDELRGVIAAAHAACASHQVTPADLPPVIHHAAQAAVRTPRPQPERIVLDELLAQIEREAIVRALAQAGGNKTEAAELLGMTRPRLYRRLVQLGMAGESKTDIGQPEFIETEASDETV